MRSSAPVIAALNLPAAVSLYRLRASGTGGMPGTVTTAGAAAPAWARAPGVASQPAATSAPSASVAEASMAGRFTESPIRPIPACQCLLEDTPAVRSRMAATEAATMCSTPS